MSFGISPSVSVREVDLSQVIPAVAGTSATFALQSNWGPAKLATLATNELELRTLFGKPTDETTGVDFLLAADYLAFSNSLFLSRIVGTGALNGVSPITGSAAASVTVFNEDLFVATTIPATDHLIARFPGAVGNGLRVLMVDSAAGFNSVGFAPYRGLFTAPPGTSEYALARGSSLDEIHVVVLDTLGFFTDTPGAVLESYGFLSKGLDAKATDGTSIYYRDVINMRSDYFYVGNPDTAAAGLGNETGITVAAAGASFTASTNVTTPITYNFTLGANGTVADADKQTAYDIFLNTNSIDSPLMIAGTAEQTLTSYLVQSIAEVRKDLVVLCSVPRALVVNQTNGSTIATSIKTYRETTLGISSSYGFLDDNWKYTYDRYNDTYRWIPCNANVAGICSRTDVENDPWFSPAGFNRGILKRVVRLAWSSNEAQRDLIYPVGVNSIANFPGIGPVLYGDRTLLRRETSFSRINVRRLFIVCEKLVAIAANYTLFELNNEITRDNFVGLVEPFLREIQGRQGIIDFRVVADTTLNTPQVIDSNQFKANIFLKPSRSINYIQLTFFATPSGFSFSEVGG